MRVLALGTSSLWAMVSSSSSGAAARAHAVSRGQARMGGLQCSSWNVGATTDSETSNEACIASNLAAGLQSLCDASNLVHIDWLDLNVAVCSCNVRALRLQWQGCQEGMESMSQGIAIARQGHGKSPPSCLLCHAIAMSRARQEHGHIIHGNGIARTRSAGHLSKACMARERHECGKNIARAWQNHGKDTACLGIVLAMHWHCCYCHALDMLSLWCYLR
jgi:hypothetical protein